MTPPLIQETVYFADIPKLRLHSPGRTPTTLLLQEGTPTEFVSERLEHMNHTVTLSKYVHAIHDLRLALAHRIGDLPDADRMHA